MPEIIVPEENHILDYDGNMNMPGWQLPSFRMHYAIQRQLDKNLLIRTRGGIGDQICAEPAIRWAAENFKGYDISVLSPFPEIYQHLPLKEIQYWGPPVYGLQEYHSLFDSLHDYESLTNEFITHHQTQCVDYSSLALWRCQLPMASKSVKLVPTKDDFAKLAELKFNPTTDIIIHAGSSWPSKTFPKDWWDEVLSRLIDGVARPVIVGGDYQGRGGTVDVDPTGCLDLRGKTSIMQSVAACQLAKVVLCNDSSVLHMAASSDAWIGFIATTKHHETITHYRNGQFGWRMQHFNRGGMWDLYPYKPNDPDLMRFDQVDADLLKSWLPDPKEFADWGLSKQGG